MSIWRRIFGGGEEPQAEQRTITTLDLSRMMGWDGAVGGVTPKSSLQSITVMRCLTLLSGLMASFPVDLYRKSKGRREAVDVHPLDRLFNASMNPDADAFSGRQTFYANLLASGNACALKQTANNRLIGLYPIDHEDITWKREGGRLVYKWDSKDWTSDEIFRVSLMSMDGVSGLSPIAQAKTRIAGHISAENHQHSLYKNKPMPGMIITFPTAVSQQTIDSLKKQASEGYTGEDAGRPMVLAGANGMPDVKFPAIPLTDLQWLESLGYGEEQIARLYGVPPHILGIVGKTTSWGSGIEQQNIGFMQYTLMPLCCSIESAVRHQLMTDAERNSGLYVRHNMAAMMRGDLKAQMESITGYVRGGIYSPNEGRAMLDMNPYQGGDGYFMQQQMWPVDKLGEQAAGGGGNAVAGN